jgi:hypothetical protein
LGMALTMSCFEGLPSSRIIVVVYSGSAVIQHQV